MTRKTTKPTAADLRQLVGNPHVYAVQDEQGDWRPVRERLTPAVLRRHRAGDITVGTYIVRPPDQARTLVFDFDEDDEKERRRQRAAVFTILDELELHYAVEDSGRKGEHIWVVADDYMDAETLYRLGRGIREEADLPKLEVFPKQRQVKDLGNLVKLPGGVHRMTGNPNDFLGPAPTPNAVADLEEAADRYPEVAARSREYTGGVEWPCVARIQEGVEEGGRNMALFHFAVMMRKSSLDDENVELVVRNTNSRFTPPLEEDELLEILEHSKTSGPIHGQLPDGYCDGSCLPASKHPGLYMRSGAMKYAQDGEAVVVEVVERSDDGHILELGHPDIIQGRASLTEVKRRRRRE